MLDKNGNELPKDAEVSTYKYQGTTETGAMAKVATKIKAKDVKDNLIAVFVNDNITNSLPSSTPNKWYNKNAQNTLDCEYYYLGYVEPGKFTEDILQSIQLKPEAGIEYKGIKFEVKVIADGVQASNNAYISEFGVNESTELSDALESAQNTNGSVEKEPDIKDTTQA